MSPHPDTIRMIYRSNADIWDYETKIKFKVLHEGKKVFEKIKVNIDDLIASSDALVKYLNAARQVVQEEVRKIKPNFEFDVPDLEA